MKYIIKIYILLCFALITEENFAQVSDYRFYGYAQIDYQTSTRNEDFNGFNQRRLNIISEFNSYNRLRVLADIEYEGGTDITGFDTTSYGTIKLSRGIIEYSIFPFLKINAGKMLSHFGLYNLIHDASASYYSVDPPIMYDKQFLVSDLPSQRLFGKYLIGAAISGVFDLDDEGSELEYFAGIGNGRGVNKDGFDLNNNRAINARIIYRPSFLYGLQFGTSFYTDKNYMGILGLRNARESSYALDIQYDNSEIQIQSELMLSNLEKTRGEYQNSIISYIQVAYTINEVITPFANYSIVDYNLNDSEIDFNRFNIGLNYSILPNLFIKGEYQFHSTEEDINATENFNILKFTLAVAF